MPRRSDLVLGWSLAAAGAVLAIAAVASVVLLSSTPQAAAVTPTRPARVYAIASSATTTVSLHASSLGRILVGRHGDTLYAFSRDRRNHDACVSISGCPAVWPIAVARGSLHAGRGVKASLLGTIKVHGVRQVTYAGHPLYTYVGDDGPASTAYVGESQSGGTWPAVAASGRLIR